MKAADMLYTNLDLYQCPQCGSVELKADPTIMDDKKEIIYEGRLDCSSCGKSFRVNKGIPRFVDEFNYADSFGFQWNVHRKTQLDSSSGFSISHDRLFGVTGWPVEMKGVRILEAGSGAGRFTEILLETGAEVVSFDYSGAVDANWANNGRYPNLTLFQGSIYSIPLRRRSFSKVFCLGVIQHTPDPEKAFGCLAEFVAPGGELVIDVYEKKVVSLFHWKYLLRPLTKRMNKLSLYNVIRALVPVLLPAAALLRRVAGRAGARLVPIVEYSGLGLPPELNKEWAVLDTFDMYAPAYDYPQSIDTVKRWFNEAGFVNISVESGPNGVVGKGSRPE